MRKPPINRIALEVIKAWKIIAAIYVSILWILTISIIVLYFIFDLSYWLIIISIVISGLSTYLFVTLLPKLRWRRWRDRKSTRLNSSHVAISYAVFCLKKKSVIKQMVRQ